MEVQYYSAQPQGILSPGSGPDHTPAYIPSYAMEGFSRTLMLIFFQGFYYRYRTSINERVAIC